MNILVSACLLGMNCRYDGSHAYCPELEQLMDEHMLIPVCPEHCGGLETPREPSERQGDRIIARDGTDVTDAFVLGAQEALRLAQEYNCHYAVFKTCSPSCGAGVIYDGNFNHTRVPGDGVTTQLLRANGIVVLSENQIGALLHKE